MKKYVLVIFLFLAIMNITKTVWAQVGPDVAVLSSLKKIRTDLILKAFNSRPDLLLRPLVESDVHLADSNGRVDVNEKAKFSYYIQIGSANDVNSEIILIPMATSRYTPTYYQTDDWWDAHKQEIELARKQGRTPPKQEQVEVQAWLEEMKLNSNPDVITIQPTTGQITRKPIQDYLLDYYLKTYSQDGYIYLYRGAEKVDELQGWLQKTTPKGVRYWTPTANYAWRYARKNTNFVNDLLKKSTPLFKFRIPVNEFIAMTKKRWPQLTLGTELTKHAHDSFEQTGQFTDHLFSGSIFLGEGHYGVEFELRANRSGAQQMPKYFVGAVTIEDLVFDRIQVLSRTIERLQNADPVNYGKMIEILKGRIQVVRAEGKLIRALQEGFSESVILKINAELSGKRLEVLNIDGFYLSTWLMDTIRSQKSRPVSQLSEEQQKVYLDNIFDKKTDNFLSMTSRISINACSGIYK